jgi:hypothetical protein
MNSIFSKLKSSATLWSVIGGFVLAAVNIVWGNDSTASSISSAILFAAPAASYIISKFVLRIKMADINGDGTISLQELADALNLAANETSNEAQKVVDAFQSIIVTLEDNKEASALSSHGETTHGEEGENKC